MMESTLNVKLMAVFALFLVVIKFGVFPLLEWQNQTIDDIKQYERRNDKAKHLVDNQVEILQRVAALDAGYKTKKDIYPIFEDKTLFRLETQILFEMLLKQNKLKQTNFFWRDSEDTSVFEQLYKSKFNVDFNGLLKDFALFHAQLSSENKQYKILNMSTSIRAQSDKSMGIVDATFTIEAYYWLGGTP